MKLRFTKNETSQVAATWLVVFLLGGNLVVEGTKLFRQHRENSFQASKKSRPPSSNLQMTLGQMQEGDVRWMKPSDIAVDESQYVWADVDAKTVSKPTVATYTVRVSWTRENNYTIAVPEGITWEARNLGIKSEDDKDYSQWQYIQNIEKLP